MTDITINLNVPASVAMVMAVSRGWTPMVEDTSQPLPDGQDEYPLIENPISFQDFVSEYGAGFLVEQVLIEGRGRVVTEFESVFSAVIDQVRSGAFDQLILAGDIDGIKALVVQGLVNG